MENLGVNYGSKLGSLDDGYVYFDFPSPQALADPEVEQKLRRLGFGYRARYIQATAHIIAHQKPAGWLTSLRRESYPTAKESLLELAGVGPKVADCVCLFGLDQPSAVPVDTHVWQIAARDYKFRHKGQKVVSMTKDVYNSVGNFFRTLWGDYAGWAHSVLFTADLRVFRDYGDETAKTDLSEKKPTPPITPQKRKIGDGPGPTDIGLQLTPPATVKSVIHSSGFDVKVDGMERKVTEYFVRRSVRRISRDIMGSPTRKA